MAATAVQTNGVNIPAPDLNGAQIADSIDFTTKYEAERDKRLGKGLGQYVELSKSKEFGRLLEDPWVEAGTPVPEILPDGGHTKFLIIGTGYGGILLAVHLIKSGFSSSDIVFVDPAGGFGGTWYWNRYPGLMCDIEAYVYMPMLEEMDYMPKHKYAAGEELRHYANKIVEKYGLQDAAMFQSETKNMDWDAAKQVWQVEIEQMPKGGQRSNINVTADFVMLANGVLNNAKLPNTLGGDTFRGDMFHTARWNYGVTGGSPAKPELTKLKDKRVGIIGTGATAVQIVPQLAKWAKHLTVFQRTASAVNVRGNRETNVATWKTEVASHPGWQKERNMNFFKFVGNTDPKPKVDMVSDGWTGMPSFSALIGSPAYDVGVQNVGDHVARMHALDFPHSEKVRRRAMQVVKDEKTAKDLQAWYPGWCKRPCFHDEYLQAFNQPNVKLVHTDGKGVDRVTPNGVQFNGIDYDVDVLIWATGFSGAGIGTVASRASVNLTGSGGQTMDEKFAEQGFSTLHGVVSRSFPNFFWQGIQQAAASPNQTFLLEALSKHISYIIATASKKSGSRPIIQPSLDGEEEWSSRIVAGAATFASIAGCTPSYMNNEGESRGMSIGEQMKAARGSVWSKGIADFVDVIEAWQAEDKLAGLEVKSAA